MTWPALLNAKNNVREISIELDRLLKESSGFSKKEIAAHKETLIARVDESTDVIRREIERLDSNLENHRRYVETKAKFLKRHYKRL